MADSAHSLSEDLLDRIKYFIEDNDPLRVSRNLRKVFFDYMKFQKGNLDADFDGILTDVESVIDLLEFIGDETKSWRDS